MGKMFPPLIIGNLLSFVYILCYNVCILEILCIYSVLSGIKFTFLAAYFTIMSVLSLSLPKKIVLLLPPSEYYDIEHYIRYVTLGDCFKYLVPTFFRAVIFCPGV